MPKQISEDVAYKEATKDWHKDRDADTLVEKALAKQKVLRFPGQKDNSTMGSPAKRPIRTQKRGPKKKNS